jgi:hypothetical protein
MRKKEKALTEVLLPALVGRGGEEARQVGLGGHQGPVHVC